MILCVAVTWLSGCSSTSAIQSITDEQLNEVLKGRSVVLEDKNGRETEASEVRVSVDSVWWSRNHMPGQTSLGNLRKIQIVTEDRALGGLEGAILGGLGGLGVGFIIGLAGAPDRGDEARLEGLGYALLYGAPIGGVIGLGVGLAWGHTTRYEVVLGDDAGFPGKRRIVSRDTHPGSAGLRLENGSTESDLVDFDAIYLRDGTLVRGRIIAEVGEGDFVGRITIRTWDGNVRTIAGSEIERLVRGVLR